MPSRQIKLPAVRALAVIVLCLTWLLPITLDAAEKLESRDALAVLARALDANPDPAVQKALMEGMLRGLDGQRNVPAPEGWGELSEKIAAGSDQDLIQLARRLNQIFGDEGATLEAIATLRDRGAAIDSRRQALAALRAQRRTELLPVLDKLLEEEALQLDAIRAYSSFEAAQAPTFLLGKYPSLKPASRQAVIETLATRNSYAEALFKALESGAIKRAEIPAYVSRSMGSMLGEKFTKTYGIKELSDDKEALIAEYKKRATAEALAGADASAGRVIYQRVCLACHQMYGEGGIVGPDLTGSNRGNLDYLLLNILDPSGDIPDAYKMVTVKTKAGQVLVGSVTEEDNQRIVLSMVGQQSVVAKTDIVSREISDVSMMPEGLLQTLKPDEVLNLIKYFQTKNQVDLPE